MNRIINNQLFQLIIAHLKEIIREPAVLFWGIVFPILMSLGLGIAFTKKADMEREIAYIKSNEIAVSDSSLMDSFLFSKCLKIEPSGPEHNDFKLDIPNKKLGNTIFVFKETNWENAMAGLKRGSINLVMTEKNRQIEFHFDPANPDAQLTYLKLAPVISNHESHQVIHEINIQPLTVKGTRYIDFLIPGLIGMGIMMSTMWGLSYGLIEKRSRKLLRRMVATPMKKSNLLVSLIIVRLAMNLTEATLLFFFAFLVFDFQVQGSVSALLVVFLAGNFAFAGIAIFASSHTAKTEIGNGLINAVVFPMMLLSGIFFSYHNFPGWSIPYIQKLPLTLLADSMRSIFIEGAGFQQVAMPIGLLSATGIVFFTIGLKLFKWY